MIKATLQSNPRFLTTIETGNHIQLLDEPVSLGGNNQGLTPVQSIYAALAGCICMTLRIYADGKKMPLDKIEVEVNAVKKTMNNNDERLVGNEQMIDNGKVRLIHAKIRVSGDLSAEQVDKLDDIAGKCPVHKMLKHGSIITHETSIAQGSVTQAYV